MNDQLVKVQIPLYIEPEQEKHLKALDTLEETLGRIKSGKVTDISKDLKKNDHDISGIIGLLEILEDKNTVYKIQDLPYNHYKYFLKTKHPKGHYQQAVEDKIENDAIKTEHEETERLKKQNLILTNSELQYKSTIREQESRIRNLTEQLTFFNVIKGYWWLWITGIGIGGVVGKNWDRISQLFVK